MSRGEKGTQREIRESVSAFLSVGMKAVLYCEREFRGNPNRKRFISKMCNSTDHRAEIVAKKDGCPLFPSTTVPFCERRCR